MAGNQSSEELSAQLELQQQICAALANCVQTLDQMRSGTRDMTSAMTEAADEAERLAGAGFGEAAGDTQKLIKSMKGLPGAFGRAGDGAEAMGKQMGLAMDAATGGVGALIGIVLDAGKSILNFASNAMSSLIKASKEAAERGREVGRAWREVKRDLGDLSSTEGKAAKEALAGLNGAMREAGTSGFAIWDSKWGGGAVKKIGEFSKAMGASLNRFNKEFAVAGGQAALMSEMIGGSGEAFRGLANAARVAGRDINEELNNALTATVGLGKKFGISAKVIGKNLDVLNKDFTNFGKMSQKELAATAAYAAKLGVEIGELTKLIDKFDNFDSAAQSVSKLSEAFGMNLDPMKMMNAENPAERMDMLRESFLNTGKTLDQLSRQELKYLEQQTGLTGEALAAAFDPANADIGFDDLMEGADDAVEELSPEEMLKKAADGIASTVEPFKEIADTLGAIFSEGFTFGFGIAGQEKFSELYGTFQEIRGIMQSIGTSAGAVFFSDDKGIGAGLTRMVDGFKGVANAMKTHIEISAMSDEALKKNAERLGISVEEYKAGGQTMAFEAIEGIFSGADEITGKFIEWIGGAIAGMLDALPGLLSALAGETEGAFPESATLNALQDAFVKVMEALSKNLGPIIGGLFKVMVNLFQSVLKNPKLVGQILTGFLAFLAWPAIWAVVSPLLAPAAIALAVGAAFLGALDLIFPGFKEAVYEGFMAIPELLLNAWDWAKETFAAGIAYVEESLAGMSGYIGVIMNTIWDTIKYVFDVIYSYVELAYNIFINPFVLAWEFLTGKIDGYELAKGILDGVINGLVNVGEAIMAPFKAAWKGVKSIFGMASPSKEAKLLGDAIVEGGAMGLAELGPMFVKFFGEAMEIAGMYLGQLVYDMKDLFFELNEFTTKSVVMAFENYTATIKKIIEESWGTMYEFENMFDSFGSTMFSFVATLTRAMDTLYYDGVEFIMEKIFEMGQMIEDMMLGLPQRMMTGFRDLLGFLSSTLLDEISKTFVGGMHFIIFEMEMAIDRISDLLVNMPDHIGRAIVKSMNVFFDVADYFTDGFKFVMKGTKKAAVILNRMMDAYLMPSDLVHELVTEADRIAHLLHRTPHFDIGSKLKLAAQGLTVNEDVKIKHKDINMYVSFTITMDSHDIANGLAYNNKDKMPYFALSPQRGSTYNATNRQMNDPKNNPFFR